MGIIKKIKNAMRQFSGGNAKVSISIDGNAIKDSIKVRVKADIKEKTLAAKKIYLWVKSTEQINIPKDALPLNLTEHSSLGIKLSNDMYPKEEFILAENQTLKKEQSYTWDIDISLKEGAISSYKGMFASHEWLFYAGIEVKGNDPDSGWQKFDLF